MPSTLHSRASPRKVSHRRIRARWRRLILALLALESEVRTGASSGELTPEQSQRAEASCDRLWHLIVDERQKNIL